MAVAYLPQNQLLISKLRGNCLCSVWNYASSFKSTMFPPERNGWHLSPDRFGESQFTLKWFDGEMLPKNLLDIQVAGSPLNEEEEEDAETEEMDNESEEEVNEDEE
ncbi:Uncharacterized protein APZ42_013007 [Daphnia magna]|uniref:Uncharacterized protein n=1 Tax=Daphnia magna TaxID=35525 RepID=A0A162R9P8_9CRUS|nr:Uncharacterized protein APZ42_013007 [Daphnia magna]